MSNEQEKPEEKQTQWSVVGTEHIHFLQIPPTPGDRYLEVNITPMGLLIGNNCFYSVEEMNSYIAEQEQRIKEAEQKLQVVKKPQIATVRGRTVEDIRRQGKLH